MAGALIVTAEVGKADFAWLDGLRRAYYPPERNRVPAHLTLFRTLPPSADEEVRRSLARAAQVPRPRAELSGILDLDSGVALRVSSPELEHLRRELADEFHGLLTSQDGGALDPARNDPEQGRAEGGPETSPADAGELRAASGRD